SRDRLDHHLARPTPVAQAEQHVAARLAVQQPREVHVLAHHLAVYALDDGPGLHIDTRTIERTAADHLDHLHTGIGVRIIEEDAQRRRRIVALALRRVARAAVAHVELAQHLG